MVKHTQTIRRQQATNCLSVFDHSVGLAVKGLRRSQISIMVLFHENSSAVMTTFCCQVDVIQMS